MKIMIVLGIILSSMTPSKFTIDFGKQKDGKDWMIVNDGVMGGLSESEAKLGDNSLFFEGYISLENNGGFASLRRTGDLLDLSNYENVKIRFKSKGRKFALRLASSERYYRPFFKHEFESSTEGWETIEMKLSDFKQYTINGATGKKLKPKESTDKFRLGLILFDKKEGSFQIEIDYIEFYKK